MRRKKGKRVTKILPALVPPQFSPATQCQWIRKPLYTAGQNLWAGYLLILCKAIIEIIVFLFHLQNNVAKARQLGGLSGVKQATAETQRLVDLVGMRLSCSQLFLIPLWTKTTIAFNQALSNAISTDTIFKF